MTQQPTKQDKPKVNKEVLKTKIADKEKLIADKKIVKK
jgi:hypothetical protein